MRKKAHIHVTDWLRCFAAMMLLCGLAGIATAQQAIERNIPEPAAPSGENLSVKPSATQERDDTPLGVNVTGIRLLGPKDDVVENAPGGISIGTVDDVPEEILRKELAAFLERPLSRALIGEIQAVIVKAYRAVGYPFVSVTVPPQEITGGALQLRIVEFRLGDVKILGEGSDGAQPLRGKVRVLPGSRIDEQQLSEDLDWLNRTPYRRVQGEFSPGVEDATSILGLRVTTAKPWQLTAGWSNTGTADSGRDRGFVGGGVWLGWLNDTTITYQLTANEDVWRKPERIQLATGDRPRYLSHAGRIIVPTLPRQALEISPNFVSMHQEPDDFIAFDNQVFELPIIYRSALSNVVSGLYFGDIYGGVEFKALYRTTTFTGIEVGRGKAELMNLIFGWSHTLKDGYGRTSFDLRFKVNPGGGLDKNDDATWNLYTGGRVDDINYAYAAFDIGRLTSLPRGFSWISQLSAVAAGQTLPDTERISLGGFYATRGYGIDEGTVDTGFIWRNELRAPPKAPLSGLNIGLRDALSPYVFADFAYGRDLAMGKSLTLLSTGVGLDYNLTGHISTNMSLGYVLRDADKSRVGDWNLQARVSLTF